MRLPKNTKNRTRAVLTDREHVQQMVKLLTHNFLSSNVRGVKNPYPLHVVVTEARPFFLPVSLVSR